VVKPRHSVGRQEFEQWESRYLPAQDFGLLILTTNQGVMHHYDAKSSRIGGRLLAYVF
jgi:small subunit ribosomal protein S8